MAGPISTRSVLSADAPATGTRQQHCFHCEELLVEDQQLFVNIDGIDRAMCCRGCQAVASTIVNYGLIEFYRLRTKSAQKAVDLVPAQLSQLDIYNEKVVQGSLLEATDEDLNIISILLADITCPACGWLIERRVSALKGVHDIKVNFSTQRARVSWDDRYIQLSDILRAIITLGYKASPYDARKIEAQMQAEQKLRLRELGLAGVLGMQVMMLSVAMYVGDWSGMEDSLRVFFSWLCLLLTTPVVLFSAKPFFLRAWRDLRVAQAGMDVPVSLGILTAYFGSVRSTLSASGDIYFDTIVMFVFFLLAGRYIEFRVRRKLMLYLDNITSSTPIVATRIVYTNQREYRESVALVSLKAGDIVLVKAGDVVPVDGRLITGETLVDESLLSGESTPVFKQTGDMLIGGSNNIEQSVIMRVTHVGADTVCSHIYRLLAEGQKVKPQAVLLASRVSTVFVTGVVLLALITAIYWMQVDAQIWLSVTLCVLVASCPCALSLATPMAMARASSELLKNGIVLSNASVLENLDSTETFIFDKTGTLTSSQMEIRRIVCLSSMSSEGCQRIASAIEAYSSHPLAKAFKDNATDERPVRAKSIRHYAGKGLSGVINNSQYYIGSEKFISERISCCAPFHGDIGMTATKVLLANAHEVLAVFILKSSIRCGAGKLIEYLQKAGKRVCILSGDNEPASRLVAAKLGVADLKYAQSAEQKLTEVRRRQAQGERLLMVGDGINDAPVLAAATISIAMGDATALASSKADLILLDNKLAKLIDVLKLARTTKRIIRENTAWAILYNVLVLPLAVSGMLEPWMAAIGMSLSSLLVVLNSNRINFHRREKWKLSTC